MEKAVEIYLSLNLNFKNYTEIYKKILKPPYQLHFYSVTKQGIFKKLQLSATFLKFLSVAKKRTLENFSRFFGVKN